MTRFARAHGSKSSNSRMAEDATNWSEFKRQSEQPKTNSSNVNSDLVKKTIKQIKEGGPKSTGWADFGVPTNPTPPQPKKSKKRKQSKSSEEQEEQAVEKKAKLNKPEETSQPAGKKAKLNKPEESSQPAGKKAKPNTSEETNQSVEHSPSKKNRNSKPSKGNQSNEKPVKSNKQAKKKDGNFKRRKPFVEFTTVHVNGVPINIAKFDGFDVKHEDALRLKEMRTKMLQAGIPKVEVDMAIKKERRNAEKALAREKKKVCFNCRKSGHVLSECPDLGSDGFKNMESTGTSNICYKCGSTEHTHFQCQVKKNKVYSFATCFICKEQGHISSQCPDNPKGLYPQGGSCKICGEVTHLKKDCPSLAKERSENVVTLDTMATTSNVESLEVDVKQSMPLRTAPPKKNKIIKF